MRYYKISISNPDTGVVLIPTSLAGLGVTDATYTSFVNGATLPGALNVELNIPVAVYDQPLGQAYVRVWGISLQEIGQANDLRGKNIAVYAGMQKGLPLAKPEQSGLILNGTINQSWGNWIGNDMTLDMIVTAGPQVGSTPGGTGSPDAPKNVTHSWPKGTPLSTAIQTTLQTAFPGFTVNVNISSKLVLGEDDKGYYDSLEQYSAYVTDISKSIITDVNYSGVHITLKDKTFTVQDSTVTPTKVTQIAFEDMIGQPTWIAPLTIQFKTVMRADLAILDTIKFPPAITTTQSGGAPQQGNNLKLSSIFQGQFQISQITHFGNFRQADAASWNTTFNVFSTQAAT